MSAQRDARRLVAEIWKQTRATAERIATPLEVMHRLGQPVEDLKRQACAEADGVLAVLNPGRDAPLTVAQIRFATRRAFFTLATLDALTALEQIQAEQRRIVRDALADHAPPLPADDATRREVYSWLAYRAVQEHEPRTVRDVPVESRHTWSNAFALETLSLLEVSADEDRARLDDWLRSDDVSERPDPRSAGRIELDVLATRLPHSRLVSPTGNGMRLTPADQYLAALHLTVVGQEWRAARVYGPAVADLRGPCAEVLQSLANHEPGHCVMLQTPLGQALLELNTCAADIETYAMERDGSCTADLRRVVRAVCEIGRREIPDASSTPGRANAIGFRPTSPGLGI